MLPLLSDISDILSSIENHTINRLSIILMKELFYNQVWILLFSIQHFPDMKHFF